MRKGDISRDGTSIPIPAFSWANHSVCSLLRAFHEQSDGRTHATMLLTGYIKAQDFTKGRNIVHDGSQTNGNMAAFMEEELSIPLPNSAGSSYTTELHTQTEAAIEERQYVMLVQEDELEGTDKTSVASVTSFMSILSIKLICKSACLPSRVFFRTRSTVWSLADFP